MPTTAWDSHTFHMPRVMHWLQQRSVDSYPTNIPRQIEYAPGVEMILAQLILLAGNDSAANLPQWFALATAAMLAAFLARELLATSPLRFGTVAPTAIDLGSASAALLVVTAPGAGLQAMSSLCDLVAVAWVMAAIALGWLFIKSGDNYFYGAGCGAAFALAFGAKVVVVLYAAPFGAFVLFGLLRKQRFAALSKLALLGVVFMVLINGNWMRRNYELVGNPLGSKATFEISASRHVTPVGVAANVVRNLSFYTRTPFQSTTTFLNAFFAVGMNVLNEAWDDPAWTFQNLGFEPPGKSKISDGDGLGNCYGFLLMVAAIVAFCIRCKPLSPPGVYLMLLVMSFVLFSGYLRWDPWHDRLQIAYFILAAPFIAAVVAVCFGRWLTAVIGVFLLTNAGMAVLINPMYPALAAVFKLRPREDLYFAARPELRATTAALADDIVKSGCTNVLLKIGSDTWEYPLWALLRNRKFKGTINHTLVDNESSRLRAASLGASNTVVVEMHAEDESIAKEFPLEVSYDTWRAFYRRPVPEQRARMIGEWAKLKYTFARPGVLWVQFEPRTADGALATNGVLEVTVNNIETNTFQTVSSMRTNLSLTAITSFSCPVRAPSVSILITNVTPVNAIVTLANLEVEERVAR